METELRCVCGKEYKYQRALETHQRACRFMNVAVKDPTHATRADIQRLENQLGSEIAALRTALSAKLDRVLDKGDGSGYYEARRKEIEGLA